MAVQDAHSFRCLAGIHPGVTKLQEVRKKFGEPDEVSTTRGYPKHLAGGDPGGDLVWNYKSRGLEVVVARDEVESPSSIIDEVRVVAPFNDVLPCGLHIGQSLESARNIITTKFQITDEYEDAIYFKPSASEKLLASIENLDSDEIVAIELIFWQNDHA